MPTLLYRYGKYMLHMVPQRRNVTYKSSEQDYTYYALHPVREISSYSGLLRKSKTYRVQRLIYNYYSHDAREMLLFLSMTEYVSEMFKLLPSRI